MNARLRISAACLFLLSTVLGLFSPPLPAAAAPAPIQTAAERLVYADGRPFFLLGVNYVGGPDRSWTMWQDNLFDAGLIERDLVRAREAGANTVRIFVRPPLQQQILAGQWGKLDTFLSLAERQGLYVVLTLADYREDDLAKVAATAGLVAARYAGNSTILAIDLKNEPQYQTLAVAQYPGAPPPLQTDSLIKQYGELVTPEAAQAWRETSEGKAMIPARFSPAEAHIYANNYRHYLQFVAEAGDWITDRDFDVSTLDYMDSPEGAKWQPLIAVLDQTLGAWLQPQLDAIRGADPARLITVGYSNVILARLPSNGSLAFQSLHRFPNAGLRATTGTQDLLNKVQQAFPAKPIVFEEFGFSNAVLDEDTTAVHETAALLHVLSRGMAGGAKWSLYNVADGFSERENNFGLYRVDGSAKPVVQAMRALGDYLATGGNRGGSLSLEARTGSPSLGYVYAASDALFVAAPTYADPSGKLRFEAFMPTQVFVSWPRGDRVEILSTKPAFLTLNPAALLGSGRVRVAGLRAANGASVAFQQNGDEISFAVEGGLAYTLEVFSLALDARIQIVWPHDGLPVEEATAANVGVSLVERDSTTALCPDLAPTVRLWRALDNGAAEPVGTGAKVVKHEGGLSFPAWEFNDIGVSATRDPAHKYYFQVSVDGYDHRTSIWSHAADARTYFPRQDEPAAVAGGVPAVVDARIQIVWPHDGLPVTEATTANIGAYLFAHGAAEAVPAGWSPTVRLWRALNNGYAEPVAVGQKVIKDVNGLGVPAWEFNDVDVSAARDPLNKYYFYLTIDGVETRSNIWSHGDDARTYFPEQEMPTVVGACG